METITSVDGRLKIIKFEGSIEDAIHELNGQLPVFKVHTFVKSIQSKHFEHKKRDIGDDEMVLQIDFAENYSLVAQDEIQNAHWSHE